MTTENHQLLLDLARLRDDELAFLNLVIQAPGAKLSSEQIFGEDMHPLYREPERLGLVRCVGSYKWEPTLLLFVRAIRAIRELNLETPEAP